MHIKKLPTNAYHANDIEGPICSNLKTFTPKPTNQGCVLLCQHRWVFERISVPQLIISNELTPAKRDA